MGLLEGDQLLDFEVALGIHLVARFLVARLVARFRVVRLRLRGRHQRMGCRYRHFRILAARLRVVVGAAGLEVEEQWLSKKVVDVLDQLLLNGVFHKVGIQLLFPVQKEEVGRKLEPSVEREKVG